MRFTDAPNFLPMDIHIAINNYLTTGETIKLETPDYLCEGFCLYASIIALKFSEEDFSFLNIEKFYQDSSRFEEIKNNLLKTKKYRGKNPSDEEIKMIIEKNFLTDARNCFFHGNFEVIEENGSQFFLLLPTRPHNVTSVPFKIRFCDIYKQAETKLSALCAKYKKGEIADEGNFFLKLLAQGYCEMASFFSNEKLRDFHTKDMLLQEAGVIGQQFMTFYDYVYSQNEIYPILKKHPKKQEELCIYRNSTAHSHTTFHDCDLRFIDIDERTGSSRELTASIEQVLENMLDISNISTLPTVNTALEKLEKLKRQHPEISEQIEKLQTSLTKLKKLLVERTEAYCVDEESEKP